MSFIQNWKDSVSGKEGERVLEVYKKAAADLPKPRPLSWVRTRYSVINKNTNPIHTQTWEAKMPLQTYKVYIAVGGGAFYQFSSMTHNNKGYPGYNSDTDSILGKPNLRCKDIAQGKNICEAHWQAFGGAVLAGMISVETRP